jgi:hypothetical protein
MNMNLGPGNPNPAIGMIAPQPFAMPQPPHHGQYAFPQQDHETGQATEVWGC